MERLTLIRLAIRIQMTKKHEMDFYRRFASTEHFFRNKACGGLMLVSILGAPACLHSNLAAQVPDAQVGKLIEQLGDSNYSNRLRAQAELENIGIWALDQLHAASFHPDPQIAASARFIVQSNQFSLAWDTDPVGVRQILTNYSESHVSDKSAYMDQLHRLEHDQGFAALCRLARYETQGSLAKRAALILMRSKPVLDQSLPERKQALLNHIVGGKSVACRWLNQFATVATTRDFPWWEKTLREEVELLQAGSVDTNLELVSDLHRWVIEEIASDPTLRQRAVELGRTTLNLGKNLPTLDVTIGNRTVQAKEFAQWALKCKLPELVQEQHGNLPFLTVQREMVFGYYLAESFDQQGNHSLAEEVATRCLNQIPCDALGNVRNRVEGENRDATRNALDSMRDLRTVNDLERRKYLALGLQERGKFQWAEAEYRGALALQSTDKNRSPFDMTQVSSIQVLLYFASMLHSQGNFREAIDVLEPFILRLRNEPMFEKQMSDYPSIIGTVKSNYHQYLGDKAKEDGETESSRSHYWEAIEALPENVDALIGLYKLDLSEEESLKRRRKLTEIVNSLRSEIRKSEELLKSSSSQGHSTLVEILSEKCNSLAWVVANTEGNKEEAIFLSRKACSLRPESAESIDTLAHCYAALGKYDDAVEQQRRAVELKPHQPELKNALVRFEKLLKESKAAAN